MTDQVTVIVRFTRDTFEFDEWNTTLVSAWLNPLAAADEFARLNSEAKVKPAAPSIAPDRSSFIMLMTCNLMDLA